ncbi:BON domain-containing protein [Stenotrophomonas tumulicola]|uniref:BON domain-containing protein n=1 Tax=Stenotrophomonas tumulicola TaxID=1685415 RepID=A0A7W3FL87_9GAMM|nr:BON domain-containing protein [Stenotrophomonas tumulicola]MBA8681594.1 BON domain-containing protein [Stenotrophomonas tumulicola]
MTINVKLLTATIGLGMLLAAPLAMANDPAKKGMHDGHDKTADSNEPVSDTWITTKVKSDLLVSKSTPGREIKVDTVNGAVTLSGNVATQQEHDDAVAKAKMIDGVKSVNASSLKVSAAAQR